MSNLLFPIYYMNSLVFDISKCLLFQVFSSDLVNVMEFPFS